MKLKNFQGLGMNINSDKYLLPDHYTPIEQPHYKGDGEQSIKELQELCKKFTEYCHQQALVKQRLIKEITRHEFFINDCDRVFTVRLLWSICQPVVFGTLEKVVEYSLLPNNGIEGFYEVEGNRLRKLRKKELKELLSYQEKYIELREQLFKVY